VRKRGPGEHEVNGREAHVKIVVQFGKARVEGVTDLLALKRAGGSVDGELSHDLGDIEGALLTLEGLVALDEVLGFFGDDSNVGAESVLGKTKLDKLGRKSAFCNARREPSQLMRTFFCSINLELGQSYTTSLPKTGVVRGW
jgi:hypothetical protein